MTPEEERFKELLAKLETSHSAEAADTLFPDSPTTLEIEIAIMKSEIFHQGRLKGGKKANVGRRQEYNSYQIIDLEALVSDVALYLFYYWNVVRECKINPTLIAGLFERLVQSYDLMANTILEIGAVKELTIASTRKVIKGWENKTLNALKKSSMHNVFLSKSIHDTNIKAMLAKICMDHIPKAPPTRIAISISKLLALPLFNLKVNIGTYRKEVKNLMEEIDIIKQNK